MSRPRSGDGGQSSVELALVLPVVALLALLVAQLAVVARHQVLVAHVAREAARAAAIADADADVAGAADRAAHRAGGLDDARLEVRATLVGDDVRVTVAYRDPTDVAMAGALLPDLSLTAQATMRRER